LGASKDTVNTPQIPLRNDGQNNLLQNSTIVLFWVFHMTLQSSLPKSSEVTLKSQHKGEKTKAAIVDAALGLATQIGLEGLSIGALAELTGMSKSGVFAHFGSREELQISVVREYHTRFEQEVFFPALKVERGLPRLRALFDNWMKRTSVEIDSGCIYISGAVEFDDRTGPVRDALAASVNIWLAAMDRAVRQAQELGHLGAQTEPSQIMFEIHGLILALHYEARFLKTPGSMARAVSGFERILQRYSGEQAPQPKRKSTATLRAIK
jgi:AcrR family transcriptional regulator